MSSVPMAKRLNFCTFNLSLVEDIHFWFLRPVDACFRQALEDSVDDARRLMPVRGDVR